MSTTQVLTPSRAAFHIFKKTVGVGVFLLPALRKTSGYLAGTAIDITVAIGMTAAGVCLLRAKRRAAAKMVEASAAAAAKADEAEMQHDEIDKPSSSSSPLTYGLLTRLLLGPIPQRIVELTILLSQLVGDCVLYLQACGLVIAPLFLSSLGQGGATTDYVPYALSVGLQLVFLLPWMFVGKNLNLLAYASGAASVLLAVVLVACFGDFAYRLYTDGIHPDTSPWGIGIPSQRTYQATNSSAAGAPSSTTAATSPPIDPPIWDCLLGWLLYAPSLASSLANALIILPLEAATSGQVCAEEGDRSNGSASPNAAPAHAIEINDEEQNALTAAEDGGEQAQQPATDQPNNKCATCPLPPKQQAAYDIEPVYIGTCACVAVLYSVFGLLGYLALGNGVRGSAVSAVGGGGGGGSPRQSLFQQSASLLQALMLLLSFPIQFVPAAEVIDQWVADVSARCKGLGASLTPTQSSAGGEETDGSSDSVPTGGRESTSRARSSLRNRLCGLALAGAAALALGGNSIELFMAVIGYALVMPVNIIVPVALWWCVHRWKGKTEI